DAADGGDAAGEPDGPGEEPDAGPTTTKFEDATVTQQSVDTGEGQPKYTYPYGTEALQTSPKFIGDPNNALAGYYISPCVYPVPLLYQYNSETNEGIPFNFGDPALSFVDMMLDQSNYPMALGAVGLAPDNLTKPMLPDNNGAKWVLELDPMTEFTGQPESWAVNAAGEKIAKIVADTEGWVDLCQVVSGAQICWRYPAAWDVPLPQSLIDLGLSACPVNTEVKP
ncbi:MAG: hypothetical protein HYV03_08270, partial [Deltaproteobacteria bacterium]|nr:hypothetical protein [Deltaproteobacteria bacterium]